MVDMRVMDLGPGFCGRDGWREGWWFLMSFNLYVTVFVGWMGGCE